MSADASFDRVSEIQNEILMFTWEQLPDNAEKFYIQGRITDDDSGKVSMTEGNFKFAIINNNLVENEEILTDEEFDKNAEYVKPRIKELHDILIDIQGKSPVRFRWAVDAVTGKVESDWTYFDQLTEKERADDWWKYWKADFAWRDQLRAELDAQ